MDIPSTSADQASDINESSLFPTLIKNLFFFINKNRGAARIVAAPASQMFTGMNAAKRFSQIRRRNSIKTKQSSRITISSSAYDNDKIRK